MTTGAVFVKRASAVSPAFPRATRTIPQSKSLACLFCCHPERAKRRGRDLSSAFARLLKKFRRSFRRLESVLYAFAKRRAFQIIAREEYSGILFLSVADGFDNVSVPQIVLRQRLPVLPYR